MWNRLIVAGVLVGAGSFGAAACDSRSAPAAPSARAPAGMGAAGAAEGRGGAAAPAAESSGAEVYMADLQPLNPHVGVKPVDGKSRFMLRNGELVAMNNAHGLQPGMIHPQHIHAAAQCPPPSSADVNGDGFIDVIEGVPFDGPILVPLDSDLSTQAAGSFPFVHNHGGALTYRETAPLGTFLEDLNAPDPNPADAVVKLEGQPLNLSGRHVVVHGVDESTPLPDSLASLPGLPAYLTLPVACGEISRVN